MMRDPRVWGDDAEEFKPERFLPEVNPRASELLDASTVPFGFGRRLVLTRSFDKAAQSQLTSLPLPQNLPWAIYG
jgi:cytochrome P450